MPWSFHTLRPAELVPTAEWGIYCNFLAVTKCFNVRVFLFLFFLGSAIMYLVQERGMVQTTMQKKKKKSLYYKCEDFYFLLSPCAVDIGTWWIAFSLSFAMTQALYLMVAILQKAFSESTLCEREPGFSTVVHWGNALLELREHSPLPPRDDCSQAVDYWL